MLDIREVEYWISRYENETKDLNDCVVWAALLSIRDSLNGVKPAQQYQFPAPQQTPVSAYSEAAPAGEAMGRYGDSEFLQAVEGLDPAAAWAVMDSHMSGLRIVNKRAYDSVILKLEGLRGK